MKAPSVPSLLVICCIWVGYSDVYAYELRTHGEITRRAFETSANIKAYFQALQINDFDRFDLQNRTAPQQLNNFYNAGTAHDWMIEGSIREDDFKPHPTCSQPQNPPTDIDRSLNHFLDVQRGGVGLHVLFGSGYPDSDWALGIQGRSENEFTVLDARVYQRKSLIQPTKEERDKSAAKLFRTLGQLSHLLQDMAQPQHTRNDTHSGCLGGYLGAGEHSWYEDYIEKRIAGQPYRIRTPPPSLNEILAWKYESKQFTTYRDFWTNAYHAGLADFSSYNFFSAGTNLSLFGSCGGLSEPLCYPEFYNPTTQAFSYQSVDGRTISGQVTLFLRNAADLNAVGIVPNVAVSSRSLWDQHLEQRGLFKVFTLNTLNYDSMSAALLPRAVGYSAGLLDYFFRGRLTGFLQRVEGPIARFSSPPYTAQLVLRNDSKEEMRGNFSLYADQPDDTRTQLAGPPLNSAGDWTQQTIPPGATRTLSFTVPDGFGIVKQFVAVFQGQLGEEIGAVAGALVSPAKFLEKWDRDLTANHPWAHSTETPIMGTNPGNGASTIEVVDGSLVMNNDRIAGNGEARFNQSYVGPLVIDGEVVRTFEDVLPVPITSRTNIQVKFDISINQEPNCGAGGTCAWQVLEFGFSGDRYIQVTMPGQGVDTQVHRGAFIEADPKAPVSFNVHDVFTQAGIPLDNLVLGSIVITQQLSDYGIAGNAEPDPLAREQRMKVDYIRISDDNNTNPDTDPDADHDANGDGLADINSALTTFLISPEFGAAVLDGSVIALRANTTNDTQVAFMDFVVDRISRFVDPAPPFETQFVVPVGVDHLTIEAIATDKSGLTSSAARTITVQPDPPPSVAIVSPAEGAVLREGQPLTVVIDAKDNRQIISLVWSIDNVSEPELLNVPYQVVTTVPANITSLTLKVAATDDLGRTTTVSRTVSVVADPRTIVVGRVVDTNNQPFPGATVAVFDEFTTQSLPDGTFSIPGVPTIRGAITATASGNLAGMAFRGASSSIAPVVGGNTDIGLIILKPQLKEPVFSGIAFSTGKGPRYLLTADFNNDGKGDLATANVDSGDVSVLLGNGDGTFRPEMRLAAGDGMFRGPTAVASGDLNGDGNIDLVTSNSILSNTVSVLLGNGDGTFQSEQRFGAGEWPSGVALADLNGDGALDMVTANRSSGDVSVLLGNGDGTFQLEQRFPAGAVSAGPISLTIADVNGDGRPDLLAGVLYSTDVALLLGNGDGTFAAQQLFPAGIFVGMLQARDLNGDGKPDVICATASTSNQISTMLGNGDGTFQSPRLFTAGASPSSIAVADLDGDGKPDVVAANLNSGDVSVLLGAGDGALLPEMRFAAGTNPVSVALAQVNGDGRLDLITANQSSGSVSVLFGKGDGSFQARQRLLVGNGPAWVAVADLNLDGKLDLVSANSGSNDLSVVMGGGGNFAAERRVGAGLAPLGVEVADLNRDGRLDLIAVNSGSNDVSILLSEGDGAFQPQQRFSVGTSPAAVAVADLNRDGNLDVITANKSSTDVSVLLGNGDGTFQPQQRFPAIRRVTALSISDLNGDGNMDLVVAADEEFGNNAAVLFGNGDGTLQLPQTYQVGTGTRGVAVADLDGDQKLDLVAANSYDDNLSVLTGNGDGTFQPQQKIALGDVNPRGVKIADADADGKPDLLTANDMGSVSLLLGNGDGTFLAPQMFVTGGMTRTLAIADLDADGKPDVITVDNLRNELSVFFHR